MDKEKENQEDNSREASASADEIVPDELNEEESSPEALQDEDENEEDEPHYAGYNRRVLASMLDVILVILVIFPVAHLFDQDELATLHTSEAWQAFLYSTLEDPTFWHHFVASAMSQLTLFAAYSWVFWVLWGNTPGKWLLAIRIVRFHDLSQPSRLRMTSRAMAYLLLPLTGAILFVLLGLHVPLVIAILHSQSIILLIYLVVAMLFMGGGVLWGGLDRHKRGFHDYLAGTAVISDYSAYKRVFGKIWEFIQDRWNDHKKDNK